MMITPVNLKFSTRYISKQMFFESISTGLIFNIFLNFLISASQASYSPSNKLKIPSLNIASISKDNYAGSYGPWMDHDEYNNINTRKHSKSSDLKREQSLDRFKKEKERTELRAKNVLNPDSTSSFHSTKSSSRKYSPIARIALSNSMKAFNEVNMKNASPLGFKLISDNSEGDDEVESGSKKITPAYDSLTNLIKNSKN